MNLHYFICELCGEQLLHATAANGNKFPIVRRFKDDDQTKQLIAVRCAECDQIPYFLKVGSPSRAHLYGAEGVSILTDLGSTYNYWSYDVGHLLELYTSARDEDSLSYSEKQPFEIGFLVDEEVNLIILAYRFVGDDWFLTPYLWHAYPTFAKALPQADSSEVIDRQFTLALIDDKGGKYMVIRRVLMSPDFAVAFQQAISNQIEKRVPEDPAIYRTRVRNLYELVMDDDFDSKLKARTGLEEPRNNYEC